MAVAAILFFSAIASAHGTGAMQIASGGAGSEPATYLLMGMALIGVAKLGRRQHRSIR